VQAIVAQTLRGATDIEASREVLVRRLIALGKAHDILLGGAAERAPLAAVVREGIGVLEEASGRVRVSGPAVEVGAKAALALALMLHEMTTNALKYGALSVPGGTRRPVLVCVRGRGRLQPEALLARARRPVGSASDP
jgi:two-component sensor histidine kinase